MKTNIKSGRDDFDWIALAFAIIALILAFCGIGDKYLTVIAAIGTCATFYYIYHAIHLFFFKSPHFDWHLINGHFLRKVCCLILLMPLALTLISHIFIATPKEMVFEDTLYECHDNELSCKIRSDQESPNMFWSIYLHFIDPGNQHMTTTKQGRIWAAVVAVLGIFLLNGLLVSSLIGWFDSRKEKWLKGEVKYKHFLSRHPHHIIIGGNDMAFGIVRQIFEPYNNGDNKILPYILIQTARNVEEFRRELFSSLSEQQQQHIIISYGSRTSEEEVRNLQLQQATEIYILGEETRTDELEPYHDTINMQCFDLITKITDEASTRQEPTKCYVMFEFQTSFAAFQSSKQPRVVTGKDKNELLVFIPFSPYESWAQKVLIKGSIETHDGETITYNHIDREGINYDSPKRVHLIIVGMSKMGTALAIETAHLAHFPNFVRDNSRRTKITFIDSNAREESNFFMGRFPDLFKLCRWRDVDGKIHNDKGPEDYKYKYFGKNFLDVEWEFREGGVESEKNREFLESCFSNNKDEIITIAVCLPWPHQGLAAALYLPKEAIHKANDIWVYQPQSGQLLTAINRLDSEKKTTNIWEQTTYRKLKPFGMLNQAFDATLLENDAIVYCNKFYKASDKLTMKAEELAKADQEGQELATEASDLPKQPYYLDYLNREMVKNSVTTDINPNEDLGAIWSIWSNIYQINTFGFKCRSLGEDFEKLDRSEVKKLFAEVEHNRWNIEKLLVGYKPLENHTLNQDEVNSIGQYYDTLIEKAKKDKKIKEVERLTNQKALLHKGMNEKDIYYDSKTRKYVLKDVKNFYKNGPMKAHPNICPFAVLPMDDKNYDICFTLALPFLMEKSGQTTQKKQQ